MIVLNLLHSPLLNDDDAMESIWEETVLTGRDCCAADQFKTYDELKTRLDYVLGNKKSARTTI